MSNSSKEAYTPQEIQTNFLPKEYQEFHKSLDTRELKTDLDAVRKSKDTEQISQKEHEIAKLIYEETSDFPVGSSILLERLLQEVKIKYLKTNDSRILLIINNSTIEWLGQIKKQDTVSINLRPIDITDLIPLLQKQPPTNNLTFSSNEGSNITISRPKKN